MIAEIIDECEEDEYFTEVDSLEENENPEPLTTDFDIYKPKGIAKKKKKGVRK